MPPDPHKKAKILLAASLLEKLFLGQALPPPPGTKT